MDDWQEWNSGGLRVVGHDLPVDLTAIGGCSGDANDKRAGTRSTEEADRSTRPTVVADLVHLRIAPAWIEQEVRTREEAVGRDANGPLAALCAHLGIVRSKA